MFFLTDCDGLACYLTYTDLAELDGGLAGDLGHAELGQSAAVTGELVDEHGLVLVSKFVGSDSLHLT